MKDNQNKGKYKLDLKSLWEQGRIQKGTRITYDVVWNILLFFIIFGVIGLFFAGGVGAGYFASLVKDEPLLTKEEMHDDIYNYSETSKIYFSDNTLVDKVRADLYREEVKLKNVNSHLKNAVIATEDEYFNTHNGVVPKAVLRAIVQEVTNSSVKTGGSTLTQQLVKNQILTNEVSFERKAKEMLLALRVEKFFQKDEILEAYLNVVPFGRNSNGENIAGIQTAAQGIFGVNAKDLSLPQSAFIAGLPQSPFGYTPFNNDGSIKDKEGLAPGINRMHEVLNRMLEGGYITKKEYNKAMKFKLNKDTLAHSTQSSNFVYPYITSEVEERAKNIIIKHLAEENGHTMDDLKKDDQLREEYTSLAEHKLRTGGYQIHTTIDKKVYDAIQKVKNNYNDYAPKKTVVIYGKNGQPAKNKDGSTKTAHLPVQVSSNIIENSTGKIIAFIGGRNFQEEQLNHAADSKRSNGSTMKPILVYGPAMDMGAIQPGSVIADVPYTYPGTNDIVDNYTYRNHGLVSARYALAKSYNVPAVKVYSKIINQDPASKYLEKMGITTLRETKAINDHVNYSTALGAAQITNEENTNAYATFGNMGNFVDAYMIQDIKTKDGQTIYEHKSKKTKVFSPQTAYLTIDMMRDVLKYGTARGIRGQLSYPGVDWAGKTGTSQNYKDTWFVATNPNVTVSMWMGYDYQADFQNVSRYSQRNTGLWADVVNAVSAIRPELMVPKQNFQSPGGLVRRSYCATSGLLASDLCSKVGLAKSDIYNSKYAPTKVDDSLVSGSFVKVKGNLVAAGPNTPGEFIIDEGGVTLSPSFLKEHNYDRPSILNHLLPNTGSWDNVALPSSGSGNLSAGIDNDGKAPAAPGGLSASSSSLSWQASSSNDVVGYRIYRASTPGGSYSLVGNTTNTSYSFSGSDGVYAVKAVDYFGQSSSVSNPVEVGDPGAPEEKPKKKDSSSDNSDDGDNSSNNNGNNEDSGNSGDQSNSGNDSNNNSGSDNGSGNQSGSGNNSGSGNDDGSSNNGDGSSSGDDSDSGNNSGSDNDSGSNSNSSNN
ncbi:penicillin-binding protein [Halobacillus salinarum]|uniref:Penicillin-binding protein n=1 Tax=Halobacillus salinarum TaxID=2932257 RepID=A0ABY4ENV4_9BACI|nr:transglycosylase domain-containing protein [Halobacillus salinarum]UOQ46133.1 penicillin-binding protein [Halobacillus salinarum]